MEARALPWMYASCHMMVGFSFSFFLFFFGEVFMLAFLLNKKAPRSLIAGEGSKSLVWLFAT